MTGTGRMWRAALAFLALTAFVPSCVRVAAGATATFTNGDPMITR